MNCAFVPLIGIWPQPGRTVTVRRPFWLLRRHSRRRLPRASQGCRIRPRPLGGRSLVLTPPVGVDALVGRVVPTPEEGQFPLLGDVRVRRWRPFPCSRGTGPPNWGPLGLCGARCGMAWPAP